MASSRVTTKVIVVGGGGTFGSSTALHLVRSGYTPSNITVLDTYKFPSAQSAGNDLNKIMGIRVGDKATTQLSMEARDMWTNDELFKPFFHNTGRVIKSETRRIVPLEYNCSMVADNSLVGLRGLGEERCLTQTRIPNPHRCRGGRDP